MTESRLDTNFAEPAESWTSVVSDRPATARLTVGLINNMPDAALEQTERQFRTLIASATAQMPRFLLYSLPGVPRGDASRAYLADYAPFGSLPRAGLDLLVITGAEPRTARFADEPYWEPLTEVLDWAEAAGVPTVLSCLAAHAAVQYVDEIPRVRLAEKCFGVFAHEVARPHALTRGLADGFTVPHSRWHEIPEERLVAKGWQVLTRSPTAGADLFAREQRGLTVCFQGHPEYDPDTLLREYRRDVRRYLVGQRPDYPPAPVDAISADWLVAFEIFRERALAARDEALMAEFPSAMPLLQDGAAPWRGAAATVWRNMFSLMGAERTACLS